MQIVTISNYPNKLSFQLSIIPILIKIFPIIFLLCELSFNHKSSALFQHKNRSLHQNLSKPKLEKYYQTLYGRIRSKDYGFAGHGDPCNAINFVQLEGHLSIAKKILNDQDSDKFHPGRRIEDHLRPKLQSFYLRSQSICDFRKFLTCDTHSRRCNCSHSSMVPGESGCNIRIGKRCAFTDQQLAQMEILIIPQEPLQISCSGDDSECVSSFGAANKICRCKRGFSSTSDGGNCRSSSSLRNYDIGKEGEVHQFIGRGRHIGSASGIKGSTAKSDNDDEDEYFLFPEEIKTDLVRLMNLREIGEANERAKEASSLYSKMESDNDQEEMVIKDIFIRRAASLKFGDHCDPTKQELLDHPPLAMEGPFWIDPKPDSIETWQLALLKDKKPLCNFINDLRCDESTQTCQCAEGMVYQENQCRLMVGSNCGSGYQGKFQFDPLKDEKRLSSPPSPTCVSGAVCEAKPLLFNSQCWCPEGTICSGESVLLSPPPPTLYADIKGRFTLHLNDDCDPKAHLELLNPSEKQLNNYQLRISSLQKLLGKAPPIQFCKLDQFLNCSFATKKCECFDPLVEEDGQCHVRNRDSCLETYSHGIELFPHGPKMWKIEQVFQLEFQPGCIQTADCDANERKCVCNNNQDGDLCDDEKSLISQILKPSNIVGYEAEKDVNEAFYSLNYYTLQAQPIMHLNYNDKCDVEAGIMLERILKFFMEIGSSDSNIAGSKTLYQYQKAAKWLSNLIKTNITDLCSGFHGLFCHHTTEKCQCHVDHIYEDGLCKLNPNQDCDPHPVTNWTAVCRNNSGCHSSFINFRHSCQCQKGWSGEACSENVTKPIECDSDCDTPLPEHSQEQEFDKECAEIEQLLEKMKNNRSSLEGGNCSTGSDIIFSIYFPNHDVQNPQHLPKGVKRSLQVLLKLYESKINICNKTMHLKCVLGKCICDSDCRIKQHEDFCNDKKNLKPHEAQVISSYCNLAKWAQNLKKS